MYYTRGLVGSTVFCFILHKSAQSALALAGVERLQHQLQSIWQLQAASIGHVLGISFKFYRVGQLNSGCASLYMTGLNVAAKQRSRMCCIACMCKDLGHDLQASKRTSSSSTKLHLRCHPDKHTFAFHFSKSMVTNLPRQSQQPILA